MNPLQSVRRLTLSAFASFVLVASPVAFSDDTSVARAAESEHAASQASGVPEGTDVWLLELSQDNGALRAGEPRNLTNRPGYDNQPYFSPTGALLYVKMEDGVTDLWRWDAEADGAVRITDTPDQGEFSPTPIPGTDGGISYIRSPDDSSGRLWRMPRDGAAPEIVFPDIGPVGYHAWFDTDHVALWRLQDPSLLQVVTLANPEPRTIATQVGRSPQSVPGRRAVSFTRTTEDGTAIELYDLDRDRTETLAVLPAGGEFHTWTPDGVLLGSAGSRVLAWREGEWNTVVDLAHRGLKLSRLAVSSDGTRLALVAEPLR